MALVVIRNKRNGITIDLGGEQIFSADPDGDIVAEIGSTSSTVSLKDARTGKFYTRNLDYASYRINSSETDKGDGSAAGTSGVNVVSNLNAVLNQVTKLSNIDEVDYQNSLSAGQFLKYVSTAQGNRWSNETLGDEYTDNMATADLSVDSARDHSLNAQLLFSVEQGGEFKVENASDEDRLKVVGNGVQINGLTYPSSDGADGEILTTNGSGTLSFTEYQPKTVAEEVKNVSGGTLTKGTPVHVTGSTGNLAEVIAADAATNYPAHFVLNEDLVDDGEGVGIALGFINNVDVPDASIYSEGDTVYLGASGGWVTTKPTGTNAIQNLGVIIKVNTSTDKVSGIVMGAGRSNDVPNIPEGQTWIGNASGVATPTTLADVATSGAYSDLSGAPTIPSGDLVDDTTPQLGGDLDVNGQSIVSTSDGNIIIQTDGTGRIGINTSTPEARFHVDGETIIGGEDDTGPVKLKILGTGDRGGSIRAVADGFGSAGLVFAPEGLSPANFLFTGNVFPASNLSYSLGSSGQVWLNAYIQRVTGRPNTSQGKLVLNAGTTSNPIQFTIADTEHARLNNDGNFGIGTSSPNEQLHVDGNIEISNGKIVSSSNGDIDIEPNGTGNVLLGNFKFDADQTVGSGQDDYVLTYDHSAGAISLEASAGGGANMENSKTSPTSVGEFNDGARLLTGHASASITAGNLVNLTGVGASNVGAQSANLAATGMLFMATDAANSNELLIEGVVKLSSTTTTSLMATNAKVGTPLYMSTTAGAVQTAAPSTSGDIVRVVGYVMNATDRVIYFKPSVDWIEL